MFLGHIHYQGTFRQIYNAVAKLDILFVLVVTKNLPQVVIRTVGKLLGHVGTFSGTSDSYSDKPINYLAKF